MNITQIKCLLVFCLFLIIGFGPISEVCLIGFYVLIERPIGFLQLIRSVYADKNPNPPQPGKHPNITRLKCFLSLLILFILDIAPVPVTSAIGVVILLGRPLWFYKMVETVYL